MRRRLPLVVLAALPLSELGHSLASQLRGHSWIPSGASHSYFAVLLQISGSLVGALILSAGLAVGLGRLASGRRLPARSAWPLLLLALAFASLQLEIYMIQELLEGTPSDQIAIGGLIGQLPVAIVAAAVTTLLLSRLGPALGVLASAFRVALPVMALLTSGFSGRTGSSEPGIVGVHWTTTRGPPAQATV